MLNVQTLWLIFELSLLHRPFRGLVIDVLSHHYHFSMTAHKILILAFLKEKGTLVCFLLYRPLQSNGIKKILKAITRKNLSIGHLNTNSIIGKIDEIFDLLNECHFDILFISETKIDKSVSTKLLSNPHYRVIRNDRKRGASGLLAYIHNSLTARRQLKLEPTGVESICLNVKGNTNTWFFVCACYRSPSECKVTDFISACSTAAENMLKIRNEIVFIGDFNIDMMDYVDGNVHNTNNPLADFCDRYCLSNTITEPTRVTNTSETLIDVILVNRTERWTKSGTLKLGISDHDLVYIVRKPRLPKSKVQTIESRSMKKFNEASFCCDLSTAPWDSAFVYDDINDVWNHWSEFYKDIIDKHAPIVKKRFTQTNFRGSVSK